LTYVNIVKRISFMFFILTLLSSLSAVIFVNININLASAKKSSQSGGGDSNDTGNGDIVSSKGSNGDGSSSRTTTIPSTDQGNTGLSTTNSLTSTTTTPTSQQQQPDNSNCNTKFMIGCVTGGSVQCIVAPCGPSSTTSTNAGNSINGGVTGNQNQCIVAPCPQSSTTSTNASPLTPQQQYQQCLGGIGGGIPGVCKPPSSTITEQNRPLQTLNPQQTCQDGSTPGANGICTSPAAGTPPCPANQVLNNRGHCILDPNLKLSYIPGLKNGSDVIDLGGGRFQFLTFPPISNTNTIAPICPGGTQLYFNYCVPNHVVCPPGTAQDEDDITCSPVKQTKQVEVPANSDGSCPVGAYSVGSSGNAGQPGTGSIICLKNVPAETTPPATSPTNTSPYLPPPSVK
jgi:hypothetical protein